MIEVEGLCKSFGRIRALDAVSFGIAQGEVIGLLGPNGSGKTTLLRILTGFFPPDAGRASVAGVPLDGDLLEMRRRVGYLPERSPLYPDLTVRRFLRFAAEVKVPSLRRRADRVAAVIEECGLGGVAGRLIGNLSKGFRQRVGIAQALVGRPQVLVLDEPTAGLDPAQVLELRELIGRLAGRTTILLSSHILADVASVCDRVLILHRGRLMLAERIDALRREVRKSGELWLRTRGDAATIERVVRSVEHVASLRLERSEDGTVIAHIAHRERESERRAQEVAEAVSTAVAQGCVAAGLPVLELGPKSRTLEDLFVDLLADSERGESDRDGFGGANRAAP